MQHVRAYGLGRGERSTGREKNPFTTAKPVAVFHEEKPPSAGRMLAETGGTAETFDAALEYALARSGGWNEVQLVLVHAD